MSTQATLPLRSSVPVRAGQVYRAPANGRGRYRFVRVQQVRPTGAYAICREVREDGSEVGGRDTNGLLKSAPFRVAVSGGELAGYYLVEG